MTPTGIVLLAGLALSGNVGEGTEEASIRKLLEDQVAAWNKGDLEGFMAGYWKSPEMTFYSGRDKRQGWQAAYDRYKERYQSGGKEMGKLSFSELLIDRIGDDTALVRGRWKLDLKAETLDGLYTLLLRKKPEGWRIVHDHTSAGEPTPPGKKPDGQ
jgi:beta-aspartyl-peptidase (threonine type)